MNGAGASGGGGDVGAGSEGELEELLLAGDGSWKPSCRTTPTAEVGYDIGARDVDGEKERTSKPPRGCPGSRHARYIASSWGSSRSLGTHAPRCGGLP